MFPINKNRKSMYYIRFLFVKILRRCNVHIYKYFKTIQPSDYGHGLWTAKRSKRPVRLHMCLCEFGTTRKWSNAQFRHRSRLLTQICVDEPEAPGARIGAPFASTLYIGSSDYNCNYKWLQMDKDFRDSSFYIFYSTMSNNKWNLNLFSRFPWLKKIETTLQNY